MGPWAARWRVSDSQPNYHPVVTLRTYALLIACAIGVSVSACTPGAQLEASDEEMSSLETWIVTSLETHSLSAGRAAEARVERERSSASGRANHAVWSPCGESHESPRSAAVSQNPLRLTRARTVLAADDCGSFVLSAGERAIPVAGNGAPSDGSR